MSNSPISPTITHEYPLEEEEQEEEQEEISVTEEEILRGFFLDRVNFNTALRQSHFNALFPARTPMVLKQRLRPLFAKVSNKNFRRVNRNIKRFYKENENNKVDSDLVGDNLDFIKVNDTLAKLERIIGLELEQAENAYENEYKLFTDTVDQFEDIPYLDSLKEDEEIDEIDEIMQMLETIKKLKAMEADEHEQN